MIIKKLHIENFGKLTNFDLDFNSEINEIYKENGWGKSTLTSFIKAMFYSMPARARGEDFKYERPRFSPWQGGKYGGYLEYESGGENYRVTRYFEKTPENDYFELKNLQTNKIITYENERLGDELFGLGRESFEVTALFPQLNFISSSTVQITANLTGLNKFQNDLENLNKALKILDSKISSLKKERPKKEDIEVLKTKMAENDALIAEDKEKLENLKSDYSHIKLRENEVGQELNEEGKQFELLAHSFNQKLALQESLTKENEKLNEVLKSSNELKDKKLGERGKNKNKRLKYFIPIPFALLAIIAAIFLATNLVSLAVGLSIIVGSILLGVASVYFVVRFRGDKLLSANIRDLDKQLKINEEQTKTIQKNINSINEQLKLYTGVATPDRQKLAGLEDESTQIKLQMLSIENDILNATENVDRLIEINEKLQNDIDSITENMSLVDEKINTLISTKEYLSSARENVSSRFVVPVNEKLKNILSKFNFENREFVVDTSWKVKESTNFGSKDFEYSSQGFQDIISFCQRINLIQEVYPKEKPIIILDDTFVNLDDQNLVIAKQIVQEIAKDYQVLYICCNKRCAIS